MPADWHLVRLEPTAGSLSFSPMSGATLVRIWPASPIPPGVILHALTLLNSVVSFAENMLASYGEFLPFAQAMRRNGELLYVGLFDGDMDCSAAILAERLAESLRPAALAGEYIATAIAYDAKLGEADAHAIATEIEDHHGNPAVRSWPSPRPTRFKDARFLHKLTRQYRPDCFIANFAAQNVVPLIAPRPTFANTGLSISVT